MLTKVTSTQQYCISSHLKFCVSLMRFRVCILQPMIPKFSKTLGTVLLAPTALLAGGAGFSPPPLLHIRSGAGWNEPSPLRWDGLELQHRVSHRAALPSYPYQEDIYLESGCNGREGLADITLTAHVFSKLWIKKEKTLKSWRHSGKLI